MTNRCILFFTDNEALVYVINKQSCQDKQLMFFVCKLVAICLKFNILFRAEHIPGVSNTLADCLSRLQVKNFRKLAPSSMNLQAHSYPLSTMASKLGGIVTQLVQSSLQPSSLPTYKRAWSLFYQFMQGVFPNNDATTLPVSPSVLVLYRLWVFNP